jgi:hypothetical protein
MGSNTAAGDFRCGESTSFGSKGGYTVRKQFCRWAVILLGGALLLGSGSWMVADDQPGLPKPGPEFAVLKQLEGTWDATVQLGDMESKATVTYKMECGGLWLVSNFKGSFGGQPFEGRGLDSYDATKKKYVSVWVDSMSTVPMLMEGTFDAEKKTMTMTGEMRGPDGKMTPHKSVSEWKDNDTIAWAMSSIDKEGKETPMLKITYKRKADK